MTVGDGLPQKLWAQSLTLLQGAAGCKQARANTSRLQVQSLNLPGVLACAAAALDGTLVPANGEKCTAPSVSGPRQKPVPPDRYCPRRLGRELREMSRTRCGQSQAGSIREGSGQAAKAFGAADAWLP